MAFDVGTVWERYEIIRLVGEGGMARVYQARHTTLGTDHALKVLEQNVPGTFVERLMQEARVQAELRHPNIVRVNDVLTLDAHPTLVMDYVDGPDLAQWIEDQGGPPPQKKAEALFRGILAGVEAAHDYGLVHRDLKPANVLLANLGNDVLLPKVTDFGLVKILEGNSKDLTRAQLAMGTPQYMAPEQVRDARSVDRRADVFSLGAILFELLSGEQAYGGEDIIDIFDRVRAEDRPDLPPATSGVLVAAIEACLKPDPKDRPANCADVRALLDSPNPPRRSPSRAIPSPIREPAKGPLALLENPWAAVGMGAAAAAALVPAAVALVVAVILGTRWATSDPVEPGGDPVVVPSPQMDPTGCPKEPLGTVVGYAEPDTHLPSDAVWQLPRSQVVYAEPPSAENGWSRDALDPVCVLPAGSAIKQSKPMLRLGEAGNWVPVVAGSFLER